MMRYVIAFLMLCSFGFAQSNNSAPQEVDAYENANRLNGGTGTPPCSAGATNCVPFKDGVNSGDFILCTAVLGDPFISGGDCSGANNIPWTFTDSLSNNLSNVSSGFSYGTGGAAQMAQISYECVTSTHSSFDVIWGWGSPRCSNMPGQFVCTRFKNLCSGGSVTLDANSNANIINNGTGITTISSSLITHFNQDLIFSVGYGAVGNGGSGKITPEGNLGFLDGSGDETSATLAWTIAANLGSNTYTWDNSSTLHNWTAMANAAFEIPIVVGTDALPMAAYGVQYYAQLSCFGGTSATPSFNLVSGTIPPGLVWNPVNGVINGMATRNGTSSLVFNCTDGTHTSSNATLSLTVVPSFGTPTIVQSIQRGWGNGGGSQTITGVNCGDILEFEVNAEDDTHGSTGYGPQNMGGVSAGNQLYTSDGSNVQKVYYNGTGGFAGASPVYIIGPLLTTTGSVTLFHTNNTSAASGLGSNIVEIANGQALPEYGIVNSITGTNSTQAISANYTTVVPNELVWDSVTAMQNNITGVTFNLPFTHYYDSGGSTFITYAYGYDLVASPSTVTATANVINGATGTCGSFTLCQPMGVILNAIRPGPPSPGCPVTPGPAHRTDLK